MVKSLSINQVQSREKQPDPLWARGGLSGLMVGLLPAFLFFWLLRLTPSVAGGTVMTASWPWMPTLDVTIAFRLDGLGLLFGLLITGIGTLVFLYAGSYLAGDVQLPRFYLFITLFMLSMLGVVLAGNLITLFVFWEMTSITSYLLIGYKHETEKARKSALQALLVTGGGGLALLAGLLLLTQAGGTGDLSELLTRGEAVRSHPLFAPALALILVGAFTKSAQFPFHFWLPNAMAAPTPVSAYLHSATMVKAGIYLLARLSPVLAGGLLWSVSVTTIGALTLVVGAFLAWQQTDLKRILAYSTVSALGLLVFLLGIGTPVALKAALVFLVVHSLYKAALFLVAGAVDHGTGTREIHQLGGIARAMPGVAGAGVLAGLSMAGVPPLFGFIGKELFYEATLYAPNWAGLLTSLAVAASVLTVVAAGLIGFKPFWGSRPERLSVHGVAWPMQVGPILLALSGLAAGMAPSLWGVYLFEPALANVAGESVKVKLSLWHGFNPMLALSGLTLALGIGIYWQRERLKRLVHPLTALDRIGPTQGYEWALTALNTLAVKVTRTIQSGYLSRYVAIVLLSGTGLTTAALLGRAGLAWPTEILDLRLYEIALAVLVLASAGVAVSTRSRLGAILAVGGVGYGVALFFMLYGAPDVAMTQFAVETLTVLLFVFVLYRLPPFTRFTAAGQRWRDALIAGSVGLLITTLMLAVLALPHPSRLTDYFAANSLLLAKGRNVVNVILVDFRSLDTLVEIGVLAIAALGVYALMAFRPVQDAPGMAQKEEES